MACSFIFFVFLAESIITSLYLPTRLTHQCALFVKLDYFLINLVNQEECLNLMMPEFLRVGLGHSRCRRCHRQTIQRSFKSRVKEELGVKRG